MCLSPAVLLRQISEQEGHIFFRSCVERLGALQERLHDLPAAFTLEKEELIEAIRL